MLLQRSLNLSLLMFLLVFSPVFYSLQAQSPDCQSDPQIRFIFQETNRLRRTLGTLSDTPFGLNPILCQIAYRQALAIANSETQNGDPKTRFIGGQTTRPNDWLRDGGYTPYPSGGAETIFVSDVFTLNSVNGYDKVFDVLKEREDFKSLLAGDIYREIGVGLVQSTNNTYQYYFIFASQPNALPMMPFQKGEQEYLETLSFPTNAVYLWIPDERAFARQSDPNTLGQLKSVRIDIDKTANLNRACPNPVNGDGWEVYNPQVSYTAPQGQSLVTLHTRLCDINGKFKDYEINNIRLGNVRLVADFEASTLSGDAPLEVVFSNRSTGQVRQEWDFNGDGIVDSFEESPTHVFELADFYSVTLTVYDGAGISASDFKRLQVNRVQMVCAPLSITLTPSVIEGVAPLDVTFNVTTQGDYTGFTIDYNGDGFADVNTSPANTVYSQAGFYRVVANVANRCGETQQAEVMIRVGVPPSPTPADSSSSQMPTAIAEGIVSLPTPTFRMGGEAVLFTYSLAFHWDENVLYMTNIGKDNVPNVFLEQLGFRLSGANSNQFTGSEWLKYRPILNGLPPQRCLAIYKAGNPRPSLRETTTTVYSPQCTGGGLAFATVYEEIDPIPLEKMFWRQAVFGVYYAGQLIAECTTSGCEAHPNN